ncbi:MAG: hypothetical protein ACRYFS_26190 [Janthinobacterium lividum]
MHSITRRAGRPRPILAWVLALGSLALLSGCGGGSGINGTSTTSEGFRIVPAGGTVTPPITGSDTTISGIVFTTLPNAVSTGVEVNVAQQTALSSVATTYPGLGTQVGAAITEAFQITLSPALTSFNTPVTITLTMPASSLVDSTTNKPLSANQEATIKIYTLDRVTGTWVVQPGLFTPNTDTTKGGTVTGTLVFPSSAVSSGGFQNALSDSGTYVVAYDVSPAPPTTI